MITCPHCHLPINQRTSVQNKSLHLYFSLLANELNEAGYDVQHTIKAGISWTSTSVKELIWRPLQKAMLKYKSTTQLSTKDIDVIYDELNKMLAERFQIHVPFPSIEYLREEK